MKRWFYIVLILTLFACGQTERGGGVQNDSLISNVLQEDTMLELTQYQVDSLEFRLLHHYTYNFNFVVKSDSLILVPREDELFDTCCVRRHDRLAVADIRELDTVWIKVARDQFSMGWIPEDELLKGVIPDDPISQAIDWLTDSRIILMSVVLLLGFIGLVLKRRSFHKPYIFRFEEMDSIYPTFLLILVSAVACLYASIQHFTPEFWQEYYFHPTLNPLILPTVMAVLVTLVWMVIIVFVAMLIDVYHHFYFVSGMAYVLEILGVAMMSYLLISWTTYIYVGYVLLPVYVAVLIWIYIKYIRCCYTCGHCGQGMHQKGICPLCGQLNK